MEKTDILQNTEIASNLADLLNSVDFRSGSGFAESKANQTADWLYMAAGVERLTLRRAAALPDFGWCRGADHYELSRDEALSNATTELIRFLFAWGALETTISCLNLPPDPVRPGKINAACKIIRDFFHDDPISGFTIQVSKLRTLLPRWNAEQNICDRFNREPEYEKAAHGLYVIYGIRNSFAHGVMQLPEPSEDTAVSESVRVSTSIALLSLQMLISAGLAKQKFRVSSLAFMPFDESDVQSILHHLHLTQEKWPDTGQ